MLKFNKKTGMFEEDQVKHLKFNKRSGLFEKTNNTETTNNKEKFEFRDFFAYVVAFIAYVVAGFVLAIIFDWMDGGNKSNDFNIIFAICFGAFMLWTTRKNI